MNIAILKKSLALLMQQVPNVVRIWTCPEFTKYKMAV